MYGDNIIKAEKIYGGKGFIESLLKSDWFCPQCKSRMFTPYLFDRDGDLDGATDVCLKCENYFQIRML